mgnify:CR=1 FL=1
MRKLKAGLSAIIKNDERLINEAESIFMHDSLIEANEFGKTCIKRKDSICGPSNQFHEFLERDERSRIQYYSSLYNKELSSQPGGHVHYHQET